MMEMLALYSIPEKLIGAIKVMLIKTRSRAITPGAEKDYLKIIAVALQGDTLAPFLYFLVQDYILLISLDAKNKKDYKLNHGEVQDTLQNPLSLEFADDLAKPSNSANDAKLLLHGLEEAVAYVGSRMSRKIWSSRCCSGMHDLLLLIYFSLA